MNPPCASCSKTVYPTEKLNCLDKIWHKACFRCQNCNMTLNMKNYKGYNKMPYCNAHYPTTKFTAVCDTPESRRIAENTKIQSSIKYHEDFEKQKGQKVSVAEDPETLRIKKNTTNQSNVAYWKVLEQRKEQENKRPNERVDDVHAQRMQPGSIADYDPMNEQHSSIVRNSGGYGHQDPRMYQPPPPANPQPQPPRMAQPPPPQIAYRAIYDYTAADDDEVSFVEEDIIINCEIIDEGWMTGTVKRTGAHGMLPSNYVERVM